jgi:hypothetical protein
VPRLDSAGVQQGIIRTVAETSYGLRMRPRVTPLLTRFRTTEASRSSTVAEYDGTPSDVAVEVRTTEWRSQHDRSTTVWYKYIYTLSCTPE